MVSESISKSWHDRDRILLDDSDDIDSDIRDEIQDSWRRSALTGVTPDTDDIPFSPDLPEGSRLLRAASPVLARLAEQLTESPATVLLADRKARIVDRRAGANSLLTKLDRAHVAPGFTYSEDSSGTNGIGTALEERRLFAVKGGEHFREALQNLACVGKPIIHPVGRKVEGILDITCAVGDANALMSPLVEAAVREIEQRLFEMSSNDERILLEEFLRVARRGTSAVVTLSSDLTMANPAASNFLQPTDKTLLWNWACHQLGKREEVLGEIQLSDATEVIAKARRLEDGQRMIGIVVELRPKSTRRATPAGGILPTPARAKDPTTTLSGRGKASRQIDRELDLIAAEPAPTLITGEQGVGKRYTATRLHARWSPTTAALIESDLRRLNPVHHTDWLGDLEIAAERGDTVLLRNIDALPSLATGSMKGFIDHANQRNWRIILTGREDTPDFSDLYTYFGHRLSITPLNQRPEEINDIARALLAEISPRRPIQRLHSTTLQVLASRDWPGNVRELKSVLRSAAGRAFGSEIAVQHLPAGYRDASHTRQMALLERAERDALLEALADNDGNKSLAAQQLGVARSTLYRKIREYGIDSDRFAPH